MKGYREGEGERGGGEERVEERGRSKVWDGGGGVEREGGGDVTITGRFVKDHKEKYSLFNHKQFLD